MESATWCRTPAAVSAGRRLRPEVSKNSSTALSSNDGELARSITTCAPATASLTPWPVMVLTPLLGEAATTSWPPGRRMATVFEPISPVPPMTTIFIVYPPLSMPQAVETAQFGRTRRIYSFIWAIRQDESPRRTVQYPPFAGRRPDFGSLIASRSDPSGTSDPEFSALRPCCQRVHGQRSLLAWLGQNSTGALVPSSPSLRLLRTYPEIGAQTPWWSLNERLPDRSG